MNIFEAPVIHCEVFLQLFCDMREKIYIFAPHSNYIAKFKNAKIKILFHTIAFTSFSTLPVRFLTRASFTTSFHTSAATFY